MNYIKQLQIDYKVARKEARELAAGLVELRAYLGSPKFREDTTVQVTDVDRRITELISAARDAANDLDNDLYLTAETERLGYCAQCRGHERITVYGAGVAGHNNTIACPRCQPPDRPCSAQSALNAFPGGE